jgi:hypothetical protein
MHDSFDKCASRDCEQVAEAISPAQNFDLWRIATATLYLACSAEGWTSGGRTPGFLDPSFTAVLLGIWNKVRKTGNGTPRTLNMVHRMIRTSNQGLMCRT